MVKDAESSSAKNEPAKNEPVKRRSPKKDEEKTRQLSDKVKESARQIWLAGLGAYNKAEEDTGKIFDKLVKEGEEFESMTREVVEKQFKAVETKVEGVKVKANVTFSKLEGVFDDRVSAALVRLGIPTKKQLQELQERIEKLEKKINK
jgi:poly(hydroxyalkanoate) granule-associated protein